MTATTVAPKSTGHQHGGSAVPEQSRADRRASFDLADFPVPSGREEGWRFTPMDRLHDLHEEQRRFVLLRQVDGIFQGTVAEP